MIPVYNRVHRGSRVNLKKVFIIQKMKVAVNWESVDIMTRWKL